MQLNATLEHPYPGIVELGVIFQILDEDYGIDPDDYTTQDLLKLVRMLEQVAFNRGDYKEASETAVI